MTETFDRETAMMVLAGCAARWMRDDPYYPDPDFWSFLERVWTPMGFPPETVLAAIGAADKVVPVDGDPEANRAVMGELFEAIGLGALWRDGAVVAQRQR